MGSIAKEGNFDGYENISKKQLEDLFIKQPVPMLKPKKPIYQKPISSPRHRKLTHSPINISSTDMDKFELKELMKKRFILQKYVVWLVK